MFLTRMALDVNRAETQHFLAAPDALHPLVQAAGGSPGQRCLWRFDTIRHRTYLLMVTRCRPDMLELHERCGIAGAFPSWETQDYDEVLEQAEEGTVWAFRLCAGVEALPADGAQVHQRLRELTLRSDALRRDWLRERAARFGFACPADCPTVLHSGLLVLHPGRPGRAVLFHQVWYDGLLTVLDGSRFWETLLGGIGFGRGFGMGLITIEPPDGIRRI